MSKKYFCCSDVHSFYDEWMTALAGKGFVESNPDHVVILCGDLFDRGSQSKLCYNFAKDLLNEGRFIYIRGNHEDLIHSCVKEIRNRQSIGYHHKSNGTLKTLAEFCDCTEYDFVSHTYDGIEFDNITHKLLEFIDNNSVNYFELGNTIFVHGWIPVKVNADMSESVYDDWKTGNWSSAKWACPFDYWMSGLIPENKTIVCGHWHTSYMWAREENRSEWGIDAKFDPFIRSGIVALDGCVPYTNTVNVVVFDEGGNLIE